MFDKKHFKGAYIIGPKLSSVPNQKINGPKVFELRYLSTMRYSVLQP